MARRSARILVSAVPRTSTYNVRELVARQAEEIEDLKKMLEEIEEKLEEEKEKRARQKAEEYRFDYAFAKEIAQAWGLPDIKESVRKYRQAIDEMKQKKVSIMKSQLQEEVRKNEKPFGWQTCGICYIEFSAVEEHTPRILNCGHTCCLGCILQLPKINKTVLCPTCRGVTKFNTETDIPKNFAVLELCE